MIRFLDAALVFGLVANAFLGADCFGPTEPQRAKTKPAPAVFEPRRPIDRPGRSNATAGSSPRTLTIACDDDGAFLTKCSADAAEGQCVVDTGAVEREALLVLSRSGASDAGAAVHNQGHAHFSMRRLADCSTTGHGLTAFQGLDRIK